MASLPDSTIAEVGDRAVIAYLDELIDAYRIALSADVPTKTGLPPQYWAQTDAIILMAETHGLHIRIWQDPTLPTEPAFLNPNWAAWADHHRTFFPDTSRKTPQDIFCCNQHFFLDLREPAEDELHSLMELLPHLYADRLVPPLPSTPGCTHPARTQQGPEYASDSSGDGPPTHKHLHDNPPTRRGAKPHRPRPRQFGPGYSSDDSSDGPPKRRPRKPPTVTRQPTSPGKTHQADATTTLTAPETAAHTPRRCNRGLTLADYFPPIPQSKPSARFTPNDSRTLPPTDQNPQENTPELTPLTQDRATPRATTPPLTPQPQPARRGASPFTSSLANAWASYDNTNRVAVSLREDLLCHVHNTVMAGTTDWNRLFHIIHDDANYIRVANFDWEADYRATIERGLGPLATAYQLHNSPSPGGDYPKKTLQTADDAKELHKFITYLQRLCLASGQAHTHRLLNILQSAHKALTTMPPQRCVLSADHHMEITDFRTLLHLLRINIRLWDGNSGSLCSGWVMLLNHHSHTPMTEPTHNVATTNTHYFLLRTPDIESKLEDAHRRAQLALSRFLHQAQWTTQPHATDLTTCAVTARLSHPDHRPHRLCDTPIHDEHMPAPEVRPKSNTRTIFPTTLPHMQTLPMPPPPLSRTLMGR